MNKTIKILAGLAIVAAGAGFAGWHFLSISHRSTSHGGHAMKQEAGAMPAGKMVTAGELTISGATARFIIAGRPGAAFMTIDNKGAADTLLSASSSLSDRVELHTHKMDGGVMKMREVPSIAIAANAKTELKSGGLHIMLFNVAELPEKGSEIPLTLKFEKAGSVDIKAVVGEPGKAPSH